MENATSLPRSVVLLGLGGIAPQAACLANAASPSDWRWVAMAAGCFYAALILSFLGGLWWMQALLQQSRDARTYVLAVAPMLAAWGALLPWCLGWHWPGPALGFLGMALLASPLADRWLARLLPCPPGWLRLRLAMASGLGGLTLALGLVAG